VQFYLNGYRPGDPLAQESDPAPAAPQRLPEAVDVLIVGCGPAGLVLAAQLAQFDDICTAIVDRRDGPLQIGQADGVACRTVEMFEAFGLAGRLLREAYWVNEVSFWRPVAGRATGIRRAQRIRDTEEGLSEFPHVIVNQARMLSYLTDHMRRSPGHLVPFYGLQAGELAIDRSGSASHPVSVTLQHVKALEPTGETSTIRARYVVGCDGARSRVRAAIGRELVGDVTDERWGVMDVLAVTDFPDIRLKCVINSTEGNMLIIPREGGYLVRLYIELDAADPGLQASRDVTPQTLTEVANRIMRPYSVEVKEVAWWSVYEIGQRLCEKFDDVPADEVPSRLPRVFIAGDACHTHSAKAGQGMNVSMADAWNLGWKLASVLRGVARPELLHTYSQERQAVARELIDFDREFSRLFSARARSAGHGTRADNAAQPEGPVPNPERFQQYFIAQGRFTAGVATRYAPSLITAEPTFQQLAAGFPIGMRLHSAPVIRLADAKPLQLGHVARADGAWRIYIFADRSDPTQEESPTHRLCQFLASDASPISRFTPADAEPDSVIDVRAVFQQGHRQLALERMPSILLPRKGRFGLIDYEKMFCPDPAVDIFDLRAVNRQTGCMIVVRPDQYVSHILPLDAHDALSCFFAAILNDCARGGRATAQRADGPRRPPRTVAG